MQRVISLRKVPCKRIVCLSQSRTCSVCYFSSVYQVFTIIIFEDLIFFVRTCYVIEPGVPQRSGGSAAKQQNVWRRTGRHLLATTAARTSG